MRQRSTRVLKHPDGSFTVELMVTAQVHTNPRPGKFDIPETVRQWVRDPGYFPQAALGRVGQHLDETAALKRAEELSEIVGEQGIYATEHAHFMRPEDVTATPAKEVN